MVDPLGRWQEERRPLRLQPFGSPQFAARRRKRRATAREVCAVRGRCSNAALLGLGMLPKLVLQRGAMGTTEQLTADDWRELELAPLWILAAVAGADGSIDQDEKASHLEAISRFTGHADELVSRVFGAVARDFESVWLRYLADHRSASQGIAAVGNLLAGLPNPAATLPFKEALLELGGAVADASGGKLLLGRRRSRSEREALSAAAQALGVPEGA